MNNKTIICFAFILSIILFSNNVFAKDNIITKFQQYKQTIPASYQDNYNYYESYPAYSYGYGYGYNNYYQDDNNYPHPPAYYFSIMPRSGYIQNGKIKIKDAESTIVNPQEYTGK